MLSFVNDYCEGMHPEILEKFTKINLEKQSPYGDDKYCKSAKEKKKGYKQYIVNKTKMKRI